VHATGRHAPPPGLAHDGALAVALDHRGIAAERFDEALRHGKAERLQVVHETLDLRFVAAGERVLDDRHDRGPPQRRFGARPAFVEDLLHHDLLFSYDHLRHSLGSPCDGVAAHMRARIPTSRTVCPSTSTAACRQSVVDHLFGGRHTRR
jgi:hypothetical protein